MTAHSPDLLIWTQLLSVWKKVALLNN